MKAFATEFDVTPFNQGEFIASVQAWIKGMKASTLFDTPTETDLDADAPKLVGSAGDSLALLHHQDSATGRTAVGFRHEVPDGPRLWRTEGVLVQEEGSATARFRIRGVCIATTGVAALKEPLRPYLVKIFLQDNKIGKDGQLAVQPTVHHLTGDATGLAVAGDILTGSATASLPVIYVSTISGSDCALSDEELDKLAFDLGGLAHVVREPDRGFSFRLKEQVDGRNVYGGAIGVAVPGVGIVRRIFLGWETADRSALCLQLKTIATELRTNMASKGGWDWGQLQEAYARQIRLRDRARVSTADMEALWDQELEAKDERIRALEEQLAALRDLPALVSSDGILDDQFTVTLGKEIYPGEISDRVLGAIGDVLARADTIGLDKRTQAIFAAIGDKAEVSGRARALLNQIKAATKDGNRQAAEVTSLMSKHGYREKSEKSHIRLEAAVGFDGLDTVTVPKSPSDWRGQINLANQLEKALGLGWIKRGHKT